MAVPPPAFRSSFFFFNDTATTEIYTLSLHDALPICRSSRDNVALINFGLGRMSLYTSDAPIRSNRSEEHTSELQSLAYLVCRLLLEKKKIMRSCLKPNRLYSSCTPSCAACGLRSRRV